ncbi:MAG: hypothetical protein ACRCVT_16665 [Leadbetterella sp.]
MENDFSVQSVYNQVSNVIDGVKIISQNKLYLSEQNIFLQLFFKNQNFQTLERNTWPIWEDLWVNEQSKLLSKLFIKLGKFHSLPARVCKVIRIDKLKAQNFLTTHHLMDYVDSKIKLGLILPESYTRLLPMEYEKKDTLVAVMTFSGKRIFRDGSSSYELSRFASLNYFRIAGAFSKMLQFFEKTYHPNHIMTYLDAEWANGEDFEKLGFTVHSQTEPYYFGLSEEGKRITGFSESDYKVYNQGSIKIEKYVESPK